MQGTGLWYSTASEEFKTPSSVKELTSSSPGFRNPSSLIVAPVPATCPSSQAAKVHQRASWVVVMSLKHSICLFKVRWLNVLSDRKENYSTERLRLISDFITPSSDLQNVNITLRILFRPVTGQLPRIFTSIGEDYDERVLPSITTEVLKAVVVSTVKKKCYKWVITRW